MATLVYAHDACGNRTAGDLKTLIDAVLAGELVRVKQGGPDEYAVLALDHLYVRNGHVAAETREFRWAWSPDGRSIVSVTPTSHYIVHYSTTGSCQRRIYNPQAANPDDLAIQMGLSWYIV